VQLELVAGKGRFRARQERSASACQGLSWAPDRSAFWAVCGRQLALLDSHWQRLAVYPCPKGWVA